MMIAISQIVQMTAIRARAFGAMTKPRVISLIVFCAGIGMFLASPGPVPMHILLAGMLGIALVAGAAAAVNCLIEAHIDSQMARTRARPLPRGEVGAFETFFFSGVLGGMGLSLLYRLVNPLTMWLTLATFVGYAVIYTLYLKPRTPQNIVIGGAAGAMPPVLGWAAVTGEVSAEAWLLFLIILLWTPPHFWALACYRCADYARSGLPMLPVTRGIRFTCLHSLLYVVMLTIATILPYAIGMSGPGYLAAALILDSIFLVYSVMLWRNYSDQLARLTFRFSIIYLTLLFASLLADHFLR